MSDQGHPAPSHPATPGHAAAHPAHRNYVKIWAILVGLLVVSVCGPFLNIWIVTLITAFGIALIKAYLVAKNFMHLDVEKPIIHWLLAVALILMVLLFYGVAPDVMKDSGRGWKKDAGFHTLPEVPGHGARGHGGAPAQPGHGTMGEPAPAAGETIHSETGAPGASSDTSHGGSGH